MSMDAPSTTGVFAHLQTRLRCHVAGADSRVWVASRIVIALSILATAWIGGVAADGRSAHPGEWVVMRFAHWDANLYGAIAERGYPPGSAPHSYFSFLPGFPAMMWVGDSLGLSVQLTGLIWVSALSIMVGPLLMCYARNRLDDRSADRWVLASLVVFPTTVFLTVV